MNTQFNCQKYFYFKLFSLVKTVPIQTIQFSQTVPIQTIQFSISTQFSSIQPIYQAHSGAPTLG